MQKIIQLQEVEFLHQSNKEVSFQWFELNLVNNLLLTFDIIIIQQGDTILRTWYKANSYFDTRKPIEIYTHD